MIKKKLFQNKLIKIIENIYVNWEQKATMLERVVLEEEKGEEFFKNLILTHKKPKIRKGAASILGYMKSSDLPKEIITKILDEKDWTVRYALSNACVKHMKNEAVEKLIADYESRIKSIETSEKHKLKLIYTECLGYMELKEAEPILSAMLKEIGINRDQKSIELVTQILYSLGEVGDKSTVDLLIHYSADNRYTTNGIRNSAEHAIDKIAKRLKFSSKEDLLEAINEE